MTKKEKLDELKEKMEKDDKLPLKKGANKLVFGSGDPETKILFIGEGPGYHEDQRGEPFVGNAGSLLNQLLSSIKLARNTVFITNVVHHRPPENRDPEPFEIEAYQPYLDGIMNIIEPKLVVTLGRFSMGKFLPGARISSVHGKENRLKWKGREIVMIPMYHPAAALRNGNVLELIKADFLRLPNILEEVNQPKIDQPGLI